MPSSRDATPVRPRAFLISLLLIPFNAYWIMQIEAVWYSGHPTTISLFFNVILLLCVLILVNHQVRRRWPRQALHPAEILVVYVMLSLASAMGGHDMLQVLTPTLTYPYYYAGPWNGWPDLFIDHLPSALMVDSPEAVKNFYDGRSSLYRPENFRPWIFPVLAWTAFLCILVFTTVCLNILFRKEWNENERLAFPVVELPLALATRPKVLCWNRTFLLGFLLAGGISLINGFNYVYPDVPAVPVWPHDIGPLFHSMGHPWNAAGWFPIAYYPSVVGLSYLMPLDMLFSGWFFFFFWKAEAVVFAWLGYQERGHLGPQMVNQQAAGAYLGIAAAALWIGRGHLREAWKRIRGLPSSVSDEGEALSYRGAVLGAAAGLAALVLFSWCAGLSLPLAVLFFLLYLAIAVGIARMRATCGPPAHDLHFAGPDFILPSVLGTQNLGGNSLGVLSVFFGFNRAYRGHPMAHSLEGFRLADKTRMSQRIMLLAQMAAVAAGCIASFWALLHICYGSPTGAPGLMPGFGGFPYRRLEKWMEHPEGPDERGLFFYALGFLIVILMPLLKMLWPGVPLHPMGFAISTSWSMHLIWCPILVAWSFKAAIIRYGGAGSYRRYLPFFMGLVLGDYLFGGLWCLTPLYTGRAMYAFWPYNLR
ncbi:MAG: hypothetical protein HYU36_09790 [Planctomycetes bacterium]|nr:hypothetical protein [Planctomycetota bacterium]